MLFFRRVHQIQNTENFFFFAANALFPREWTRMDATFTAAPRPCRRPCCALHAPVVEPLKWLFAFMMLKCAELLIDLFEQ